MSKEYDHILFEGVKYEKNNNLKEYYKKAANIANLVVQPKADILFENRGTHADIVEGECGHLDNYCRAVFKYFDYVVECFKL